MIYTMADLDVMHPGLYWKRAGWILYELREGGESGDNKIKLDLSLVYLHLLFLWLLACSSCLMLPQPCMLCYQKIETHSVLHLPAGLIVWATKKGEGEGTKIINGWFFFPPISNLSFSSNKVWLAQSLFLVPDRWPVCSGAAGGVGLSRSKAFWIGSPTTEKSFLVGNECRRKKCRDW